MPNLTCANCGQRILDDAERCSVCQAALAVATAEHAVEAKVVLPSAGQFSAGLPPAGIASPPLDIRKGFLDIVVGWLPYLIALGVIATVVGLLAVGVRNVRHAAERTQTVCHLKCTACAVHAYNDIHKQLPSPKMILNGHGAKRETDLSWRVAILPYIDQNELFNSLDAAKGWNDQRNAFAQDRMPHSYHNLYRQDRDDKKFTHFQVFTGPGTLYPDNGPRTFNDIRDGSRRTFLFAEAAEAVVWTRPADMEIRPDRALPLPRGKFMASMADATIRTIDRGQISDDLLRQVIDLNDGRPKLDQIPD